MKVKDLYCINGGFDVYENIADGIGVGFENDGKEWLTEEGKKHFKSVLDFEVEIRPNVIIILTDKKVPQKTIDRYDFENYEGYPPIIKKLNDLFWSYSGECTSEQWAKWFIEK
jgi:hypothetical protein